MSSKPVHTSTSTMGSIEPLLRAQEAGKILKVSLPHIYQLADRGQLPCIRWQSPSKDGAKRKSRVLRFRVQDILDFIDQNYHNKKEYVS